MLLIFVLVYFDVVIFFIKKVIHSNYVICCNSRKKYFPYIIISIQYFPFIKRPFKINASIKMQLIALFSTGIYKVIPVTVEERSKIISLWRPNTFMNLCQL